MKYTTSGHNELLKCLTATGQEWVKFPKLIFHGLKCGILRDVFNSLDSSKFSEILNNTATPDKFPPNQIKITFRH